MRNSRKKAFPNQAGFLTHGWASAIAISNVKHVLVTRSVLDTLVTSSWQKRCIT